MAQDRPQAYTFGPFRVDVEQGALYHAGALVPLTPKAFQTLAALVENAGRVMSKADLIRTIWPDTFVEESNLTQNVFTLRRLLGDAPGGRAYIETVPRRGYRLA